MIWRLLVEQLHQSFARITLSLLLLLTERLAVAALPLIFSLLIDHYISGERLNAQLLIAVYAFSGFLIVVLGEIRELTFLPLAQRVHNLLVSQALVDLHRKSLSFHAEHGSPALTRTVNRAVWSLDSFFSIGLFNIVPSALQFFLAFIILWFHLGVAFALALAASAFIFLVFTVRNVRRQQELYGSRIDADNSVNAIVGDSLLNAETVMSFSSGDQEIRRLRAAENRLSTEWRAQQKHLSMGKSVQSMISQLGLAAMLSMAFMSSNNEAISAGNLVLVNMYVVQVFNPLQSVGLLYTAFMQSITDIHKLGDLLDRSPSMPETDFSIDPVNIELAADSLWVLGENDTPLVQDATLCLPTLGRIAVVGPSGAGKTTLVRALAGLIEPSSGVIRLHGNVSSQEVLRGSVMYVSQTPGLFDESIGYNIRYGSNSDDEETVDRVVGIAQLDQFISGRPEGADAAVGEQGCLLSGGERQRVALARALLSPHPIIILDEATSQLDASTESKVLDGIKTHFCSHSFIIVTHRLETTFDVDLILYMENGQITERGTHEELLSLNGNYAKLWKIRQQKILEADESR